MKFQYERLEKQYDKIAENYDEHAQTFWGFDRSLLAPYLRGAKSVVEFGIGTGLNLPHYPADAVVTGIELSNAMLSIAQKRAKTLAISPQLRHGPVSNAECQQDSFDIGVATWFFSVTPSSQQDFNSLISCLKPGGRALIVDHFVSEEWTKSICPEDRFLVGSLHHRYFHYDPFRDITEWVNDCPATISVRTAGSIGFFGNSCKRNSYFYEIVKE